MNSRQRALQMHREERPTCWEKNKRHGTSQRVTDGFPGIYESLAE